MKKIYQALEVLKQELIVINGDNLAIDLKSIENKEVSTLEFVPSITKPSVIPEDYKPASPEEHEQYTKGVIQSIWNIADYASYGYAAAYWYSKNISASFDYLGNNWCPKVINDQTYRVAKALEAFLEAALETEALEEITNIGGMRDSAASLLLNLQKILVARIAIYEVHTKESIDKYTEVVRKRDARLELCAKTRNAYDQSRSALHKVMTTNCALIDSKLTTNQVEPAKQSLEQLQQAFASFESSKALLTQDLETWNADNVSQSLPATIRSSNYLQAMDAERFPLWKGLYNSGASTVIDEDILNALTLEYTTTKELFANLGEATEQAVTIHMESLNHKITDSQLLQDYVTTMKNYVTPAVMDKVNVEPYVKAKTRALQQEQLVAMQDLREQLNQHLLGIRTQSNELSSIHPIPVAAEKFHQAVFDQVMVVAKDKIVKKISVAEHKLSVLDSMIQQAISDLHALESEEANASEFGRRDLLEGITKRITALVTKISEVTAPEKERAERDYRDFTKVQLQQEREAINKKYNELPRSLPLVEKEYKEQKLAYLKQQAKVTDLEQDINDRRVFLDRAKARLQTNVRLLAEYNGLYVPADSMPKVELKADLECSEEQEAFIDALYEIASQGSSWLGLNSANLYNNYQYYTGTETVAKDLPLLKQFMEAKIALIDNEISNQFGDATAAAPKSLNSLNKALELQRKALLEPQQKHLKLQEEFGQLTKARKEELDALVELQNRKSSDRSIAQLKHQLQCVDRSMAIILRDYYKIEFKLHDIDVNQQRLTQIRNELEGKNVEDGLAYFAAMKTVIDQTGVDYSMKSKSNPDEFSGYELLVKIDENFTQLDKDMLALDEFLQKFSQVPADVSTRVKDIRAEMVEYREKNASLRPKLTTLRELNEETTKALRKKQQILLGLSRLAKIQQDIDVTFPEYKQNGVFPAVLDIARNNLINALSAFLQTNYANLDAVLQKDELVVKNQYILVSASLEKMRLAHIKLQLKRSKDEIFVLLTRFEVETKGEKESLLRDVANLKERDAALVNIIETSDEAINDLVKEIKARMIELDYAADALKDITDLPEETEIARKAREYSEAVRDVNQKFFDGTDIQMGIFAAYLTDRALKYWFKDCLRSVAAFGLSCFGYKSDQQLRSDYINKQLKPAFNAYQAAIMDEKSEKYASLMAVVDRGIKEFASRTKPGAKGYENSLRSKLESFKTAVSPLNTYEIEEMETCRIVRI